MRHKAENHRGTIFCHSPSEHFSLKEKKKNNQLQNLILKKEKKKKTSPLSQLFHPLHVLNTHVVPDSWKKKKKRPPGWSHVKDLRRKNCFKRKKRNKVLESLEGPKREEERNARKKAKKKKTRLFVKLNGTLVLEQRAGHVFISASVMPRSFLASLWTQTVVRPPSLSQTLGHNK